MKKSAMVLVMLAGFNSGQYIYGMTVEGQRKAPPLFFLELEKKLASPSFLGFLTRLCIFHSIYGKYSCLKKVMHHGT